MDKAAARDRLSVLRAKADAFFAQVAKADVEGITCHAGCADCCAVDLGVFEVEAARLTAALRSLSAEILTPAAERARSGHHCVLLDPDTRRCIVYAERPLICRTHGLAIRTEDGHVDWCPHNYAAHTPAADDTLALDRLNVPLALLDHLAGGGGRRIRLADLVLALGV